MLVPMGWDRPGANFPCIRVMTEFFGSQNLYVDFHLLTGRHPNTCIVEESTLKVFVVINFPLKTDFASYYKVWYIVPSLSVIKKYFQFPL